MILFANTFSPTVSSSNTISRFWAAKRIIDSAKKSFHLNMPKSYDDIINLYLPNTFPSYDRFDNEHWPRIPPISRELQDIKNKFNKLVILMLFSI